MTTATCVVRKKRFDRFAEKGASGRGRPIAVCRLGLPRRGAETNYCVDSDTHHRIDMRRRELARMRPFSQNVERRCHSLSSFAMKDREMQPETLTPVDRIDLFVRFRHGRRAQTMDGEMPRLATET